MLREFDGFPDALRNLEEHKGLVAVLSHVGHAKNKRVEPIGSSRELYPGLLVQRREQRRDVQLVIARELPEPDAVLFPMMEGA